MDLNAVALLFPVGEPVVFGLFLYQLIDLLLSSVCLLGFQEFVASKTNNKTKAKNKALIHETKIKQMPLSTKAQGLSHALIHVKNVKTVWIRP